MKTISIFGSTGSIGEKTLRAAKSSGFDIVSITANCNHVKLIEQSLEYHPQYVCVTNDHSYTIVKRALSDKEIRVVPKEEINEIAQLNVDCCVMAISGIAGLEPVFACLGNAKRLAIATKEVIISAGKLLINSAKDKGTEIIPIDSEHSAIFQCLIGENVEFIKEIILTASGGPFVNFEEADLEKVTVADALKHPNWSMGSKITIDSATLINKALEIIEASYLFSFPIERIKPLIHTNSIIHGLVKFNDNSFKAALSFPDMIFPISYALNYPKRTECDLPDLDFSSMSMLNFKQIKDWQRRNVDLAYQAFRNNKVIALNMANEYAVSEFLKDNIKFSDIYRIVSNLLEKSHPENPDSLSDINEIINIILSDIHKFSL